MLKPHSQFGSDQVPFPSERKSKVFLEEEAFLQEHGSSGARALWALTSLSDAEIPPPKSGI